MTNRFDQVTQLLTDDAGCQNRCELAWFHLWNPNGAAFKFEAVAKEVGEAIDAGRCKSGAYYVHGFGNTHHLDELMKLSKLGRRAKVWDIQYHINGLHDDAAKARLFLESL